MKKDWCMDCKYKETALMIRSQNEPDIFLITNYQKTSPCCDCTTIGSSEPKFFVLTQVESGDENV